MDKEHKLTRSGADIIYAKRNIVEGKLYVLPMYNCNYGDRSVTEKIVLMFRLDCFVEFIKHEPTFKALILVDNNRKMSDYIRKGAREKKFKVVENEWNILLMNFEKTLSLLDVYEQTHDVHISIKIP